MTLPLLQPPAVHRQHGTGLISGQVRIDGMRRTHGRNGPLCHRGRGGARYGPAAGEV